MMIGRKFKVILVFFGVVLWFLPQEALGEDVRR